MTQARTVENDPVQLVRRAWAKLEGWWDQRCPAVLESLYPGATTDDVIQLDAVVTENASTDLRNRRLDQISSCPPRSFQTPRSDHSDGQLKRRLPPDVIESLSIHDGDDDSLAGAGALFGMHLLTCEEIAQHWVSWQEFEDMNQDLREGMTSYPPDAIARDYTNRGWIALSRDSGGNFIGVDLSPERGGELGQVINFGRDEREKCVLARSWGEFLLSYARFLELSNEEAKLEDLGDWNVFLEAACGKGHPHEILRRWTREGCWPLREE